MNESYLMHHGILGMKWGVRRYQKEDGSLTAAGLKRQRKNQKNGSQKKQIPKHRDTAKQYADKDTLKKLGKRAATAMIIGGVVGVTTYSVVKANRPSSKHVAQQIAEYNAKANRLKSMGIKTFTPSFNNPTDINRSSRTRMARRTRISSIRGART